MPQIPIGLSVTATASAKLDSRYTFTFQFLRAADFFAREAKRIESIAVEYVTDEDKTQHRAFVAGAIMQAVATLEAEAYEVTHHGPGYHLGSNGANEQDRKFLEPLHDVLDAQPVLSRFDLILHLLRKPHIDHGAQPHQDMVLVVKLRNELVHYKSLLGEEMDGLKFIQHLRVLNLLKSPFTHASSNFLPHQVLGAACAQWATDSAILFLKNFHAKLGYSDYMDRFLGRLANRTPT